MNVSAGEGKTDTVREPQDELFWSNIGVDIRRTMPRKSQCNWPNIEPKLKVLEKN